MKKIVFLLVACFILSTWIGCDTPPGDTSKWPALGSKEWKEITRDLPERTDGDFKYKVYQGHVIISDVVDDAVIESISVPAKIKGRPVTVIDERAFGGCNMRRMTLDYNGLESITIPDSVTAIGKGALSGFGAPTSIEVARDNPAFTSVDGVLFSKDMKTLLQYPTKNENRDYTIPDSVTTIAEEAFYMASSLTSVTIGNSVKTIGKNAFDSCRNLTSVTIPDSVTTIGENAFYNCEKLASVTIPDSVKTIGKDAFCNCKKLASVTIPDSVKTIEYGVFNDCESLKSVTIPESVKAIGDGAFGGCDSLTSVTIPDSVTTIGGGAFGGCDSLKSVTIPDSVTNIGHWAFGGCNELTSIEVGPYNSAFASVDGVLFSKDMKTLIQYPVGKDKRDYTIPASVKTIGKDAFYNCEKLASVTIPNSVTTIGDGAFGGCDNLKSVTMPKGVKIGKNAFSDCPWQPDR